MRRSGFTLVELLVVIGIIAVLISILLPALNRARSSANSLSCLSNLKQMGIAIQMYAGANKGSLPIAYWDGYTSPGGKADGTDWAWLILPYMKKGATGTYSGTDPGNLWKLFKDTDTITGDSSATLASGNDVQTYSCNQILFGFAPGPLQAGNGYPVLNSGNPGPADDGKRPFKLSRVKRGGEMMLIMDAAQFGKQGGRDNCWAADADFTFMQGSTNYDCRTINLAQMVAKYPQGVDAGLNKDYATLLAMQQDKGSNNARGNDLRFRHIRNSQANALFADGHASIFHFKRPGVGGSDIVWANLIPDELGYVVP